MECEIIEYLRGSLHCKVNFISKLCGIDFRKKKTEFHHINDMNHIDVSRFGCAEKEKIYPCQYPCTLYVLT